jgi:transcription elongation GreA/GreB family factor
MSCWELFYAWRESQIPNEDCDMNPEDLSPPSRPLLAAVGAHVVLELITEDGESEQLEFDLVSDRSADFARGFLGESTPLAQAILGQPIGRPLLYQNADIRAVRILAIAPSQAPGSP